MEPGTKGAKQGCTSHLVDVVQYISSAWDSLSQETIHNCLQKCNPRIENTRGNTKDIKDTVMDEERGKNLQNMVVKLLETIQQDEGDQELTDDINDAGEILYYMARTLKDVYIYGKIYQDGYDNIFNDLCELEGTKYVTDILRGNIREDLEDQSREGLGVSL